MDTFWQELRFATETHNRAMEAWQSYILGQEAV